MAIFSFSSLIAFTLSIWAVFTVRYEVSKIPRIILGSVASLISFIPIFFSVYNLYKMKTSRYVKLKNDLVGFVLGDKFQDYKLRMMVNLKNFHCDPTRSDPYIDNRNWVITENPSNAINFGELEEHDFNYTIAGYRQPLTENRNDIFVRDMDITNLYVEINLSELDVILDTDRVNFSFLVNELVIDLNYDKGFVKIRIKADKENNYKNEINKFGVNKHSFVKWVKEMHCSSLHNLVMDPVRMRRGVLVSHIGFNWFEESDGDQGKVFYKLKFNKNILVCVEDVEKVSYPKAPIKPEYETDEKLIRSFYNAKLKQRYGAEISKVFMDYTKDYWGEIPGEIYKFMMNSTTCKNKGIASLFGNWKFKRYCADLSFLREKVGLRKLFLVDKKIKPTRIALYHSGALSGKKAEFMDYGPSEFEFLSSMDGGNVLAEVARLKSDSKEKIKRLHSLAEQGRKINLEKSIEFEKLKMNKEINKLKKDAERSRERGKKIEEFEKSVSDNFKYSYLDVLKRNFIQKHNGKEWDECKNDLYKIHVDYDKIKRHCESKRVEAKNKIIRENNERLRRIKDTAVKLIEEFSKVSKKCSFKGKANINGFKDPKYIFINGSKFTVTEIKNYYDCLIEEEEEVPSVGLEPDILEEVAADVINRGIETRMRRNFLFGEKKKKAKKEQVNRKNGKAVEGGDKAGLGTEQQKNIKGYIFRTGGRDEACILKKISRVRKLIDFEEGFFLKPKLREDICSKLGLKKEIVKVYDSLDHVCLNLEKTCNDGNVSKIEELSESEYERLVYESENKEEIQKVKDLQSSMGEINSICSEIENCGNEIGKLELAKKTKSLIMAMGTLEEKSTDKNQLSEIRIESRGLLQDCMRICVHGDNNASEGKSGIKRKSLLRNATRMIKLWRKVAFKMER